MKGYRGTVTCIANGVATVNIMNLTKIGDTACAIRIPSQYSAGDGLYGLDMGDAINVAIPSIDKIYITTKYDEHKIFFIEFKKNENEYELIAASIINKDLDIDVKPDL